MTKLVLLSKMKNKNVRYYTFEDWFIKNCLKICVYIYIHIFWIFILLKYFICDFVVFYNLELTSNYRNHRFSCFTVE